MTGKANVGDAMRGSVRLGAAIRVMILAAICMLGGSPALAEGTPAAEGGTPAATPVASPVTTSGVPHFPDLVALPPDDLYYSRELLPDGRVHLLLRFSSTAWNAGEGPLELAGDPDPAGRNVVYQHIYDAATGGTLVESRELGLDLIFHPEHHHFHLADYAAYELLRVEPDGSEVPTGQGGKQSSCVLDSIPVDAPEQRLPAYSSCTLSRQGLSVGWGDTYSASLPDQWIDLGDTPLADGEYLLRYAVDPRGQLSEDGRVDNNVATTRFTIRDGEIADRPAPPRCALEGETMGRVGAPVILTCSHFPEQSVIQIYWDGWDPWDDAARPVAFVPSEGDDPVTVTFPAPASPPGGRLVTAVAWDSEARHYVSATVIFAIEEGPPATPVAATPVSATPSATPVPAG